MYLSNESCSSGQLAVLHEKKNLTGLTLHTQFLTRFFHTCHAYRHH